MLKQVKSAGLRALREVASLPLRTLGNRERDRVLEKLTGSMISELRLPERPLRFMTSTPLLQARANSILLKEPDTIREDRSIRAERRILGRRCQCRHF